MATKPISKLAIFLQVALNEIPPPQNTDMSDAKHQKAVARCAAARLLAGMLATLGLGGCSDYYTRIEATDKRTFLPALRANINFGEDKQVASEPHTGHAIEIGIAKARGSDSQWLSAAQPPISLNDTSFNGPQKVQVDFDTSFSNISWRWRKFFAERSLGLEVTAGVGFSSLDLAVSSTSSMQRASEHYFTRGPQAGVGLIWRLNPSTSLHGRVSVFISNPGVDSMGRFELYFAKSLHKNLALRAGYARWDASGESSGYGSAFDLLLSGPILALDWDFDAGSKTKRPESTE